MILFTIYGLFTKMLYDGDRRKTPEYTKEETKEKNSLFGCSPILPSTLILFRKYGLFTKMLYDGDRRKTPKYTKEETKEKNSLFGCSPILPSTKLRPTVFRCPKTPKTSRTYPKWERVPNLMGQKKTGLGAVWAVNGR